MPDATDMLERFAAKGDTDRDGFAALIRAYGPALSEQAARLARERTEAVFGDRVYVRGLIEISNFCRNDCNYCGLRRGNQTLARYRLTRDEILARCRTGYELGFRTFVLQGGEDAAFSDPFLLDLVQAIRAAHPDAAITLSLGERSRASYQALFAAGANRYLLRHETADPKHYAALHPAPLSLADRLRSLRDLREIGYQTGCGFMVGSPFQTPETLAADLEFIRSFQPQMVGIGPFLPHAQTPFAGFPAGDLGLTLFMVSLTRLLLPRALLPATTALGALDPEGREKGLLAGANVLMPNLSPPDVRSKYQLYDRKPATAGDTVERLEELRGKLLALGRRIVMDRGDFGESLEHAGA